MSVTIATAHPAFMASTTPRHGHAARKVAGFTLIEIMLALIVASILASIAIGAYQQYMERLKISQAIMDISKMSQAIERYHTENWTYPASLAGMGFPATDPWGNPYQYLAIDVTPAPNTGARRRDRNMNPLNSDYDLYSMGPDGKTQKQISAQYGRDDIVRAGNGSFIGIGKDF